MGTLYMTEKVLLNPYDAPHMVGVGQEDQALFIISACHLVKVTWNTVPPNHWQCSTCGVYARGRVGGGMSCLMGIPGRDDPNFMVKMLGVGAWVSSWTGLEQGEFEVKVTW